MNCIRKTIIALAALLPCLSATVCAEYIDSVYYNYTAKQVEINGRFFDDFNNEYATVIVLRNGGDIDGIQDEQLERVEQVKIENGKFSVQFPLSNAKSGKYTAYIEAGNKSRDVGFAYAENIDEIFSEIMSSATADVFAEAIGKYAAELNISDSIYGAVDNKAAAAKMAYSEKSKASNPDELRDLIKAYSYAEAFNESKTELVHDRFNIVDEDILGLTSLDKDYGVTAYSLYKGSINDAGKAKVFEMMKNKSFKNLDDMKRSFIYNCTIAAVKNNKNSGISDIKNILTANNGVNGFDLTNYNKQTGNSIDLKLINGSEWEKSDIQKVLNMQANGSKSDTKGDIGSGGGSGNSRGDTIGGGKTAGGYSQSYNAKSDEAPSFGDIDDVPWAKAAILRLSELGIINGRDDNTFAPNENVTRAEFLKMIITSFKLEANDVETDFADVSASDWYYDYVKTAYALKIAGGYGNGYFGADDNITRQDATVITERAANAANISFDANSEMPEFKDGNEISEYAVESINRLVQAGILHGNENGEFLPKDNCTRAQAAVMLANILGNEK